jgi:hypothetical protein
MTNDREEIVLEWLARAEQFWISSRVAQHEFGHLFPALHIHALALEMMLKTAILSLDPADLSWATFNCRRIFTEGHNIVRLVQRWNSVHPRKKITKRDDGLIGWEDTEEELFLSEHSFAALGKYSDLKMVGRYFEGQLEWNTWAVDAANVVFFALRNEVKTFLKVDHDFIDSALDGSCGQSNDAAWLRRATRKSNVALPINERICD